MSTSRRDFLKFAALLSGATGISSFVPESIQRALAIEPELGSSFADAEHIVILMQQNRSFDHAFGTLQGVRGFNDPRAIRQPNGNSVFVQTSASSGKSFAPWRLDLRDTRITWMGSVPHSATHRSMHGMRAYTTTGSMRRSLPTGTIRTSPSRWATIRVRTCLFITRSPMHSQSAIRVTAV